ncbi:tetratricopeptide repeat protein, partial [Nocardia ninae]
MSHPGEQENASSVEPSAPRSSIWQGFLGTASVVAYALLFELARNVVVNSLGESPAVEVAAGTLRWLSVLVVVAAAVYVGYRFVQRYREKVRTAHELDMIADLVEPGPPVSTEETGPRPDPNQPRTIPGWNDKEVAVLRELPGTEFETGALLAVLTAVLDAPARLPSAQDDPPRTAAELLRELLRANHLKTDSAQRYCLLEVPQLPPEVEVKADPRWAAALTALVHYYADRAARWALALDSVRFAAGARRWFKAEEPNLCKLVRECKDFGSDLPTTLVPELVRVGDALDGWYARIGAEASSRELAAVLRNVEGMKALVLHHDLFSMRAGALNARPKRYRPRNVSTSLAARWEHQEALRKLTESSPSTDSSRDLDAVVAHLESAWWLLPREDVAGEVCALINMAVVHIHQGRLDAAQDRLELAESLTRDGRDPDGRAHIRETMGIVWWSRGEPRRALRCWQQALTAYRTLADNDGTARCLKHLGSAMLVAPGHGGTLLPAD